MDSTVTSYDQLSKRQKPFSSPILGDIRINSNSLSLSDTSDSPGARSASSGWSRSTDIGASGVRPRGDNTSRDVQSLSRSSEDGILSDRLQGYANSKFLLNSVSEQSRSPTRLQVQGKGGRLLPQSRRGRSIGSGGGDSQRPYTHEGDSTQLQVPTEAALSLNCDRSISTSKSTHLSNGPTPQQKHKTVTHKVTPHTREADRAPSSSPLPLTTRLDKVLHV